MLLHENEESSENIETSKEKKKKTALQEKKNSKDINLIKGMFSNKYILIYSKESIA